MLVIYISLVFIVLGLIFLIMSTKTEVVRSASDSPSPLITKKGQQGRNYSEREVSVKRSPATTSSINTNEYVFYDRKDEIPPQTNISQMNVASSSTQPSSSSAGMTRINNIMVPGAMETEQKQVEPLQSQNQVLRENVNVKGTEAVLYEDKDKSVNFSSDYNTLSIEKFNNLSRIGKGAVVLSDDSLSFRFDNKLYRFDFYKLKEIRGDKNAVLLFPDTLPYPLLAVSPSDNAFSHDVLEAFTNFKKGS